FMPGRIARVVATLATRAPSAAYATKLNASVGAAGTAMRRGTEFASGANESRRPLTVASITVASAERNPASIETDMPRGASSDLAHSASANAVIRVTWGSRCVCANECLCTAPLAVRASVRRPASPFKKRQGGDPLAWSQPEIAHIRDSQRIERESHGKIQHRESNEKESRFASAPIQIAKCRNYYEDEKQAFVEAEIMKSHSAGGRLQCLSCGVIHASDECPRGRGLEADRERKRGNGSGMVMRERTPYAAEGEAEGEHKG